MSYMSDQAIRLIGFDIYCSTLTQFVADGHQIPLRDGSVDGVLVQAGLEHVLDPWRVVAEIHRVLKDDGLVYAETPFMQQVHEGPYDFTRFTESGHRYLFPQIRAHRLGPGARDGLPGLLDGRPRGPFPLPVRQGREGIEGPAVLGPVPRPGHSRTVRRR